jgi:hypothetical protein
LFWRSRPTAWTETPADRLLFRQRHRHQPGWDAALRPCSSACSWTAKRWIGGKRRIQTIRTRSVGDRPLDDPPVHDFYLNATRCRAAELRAHVPWSGSGSPAASAPGGAGGLAWARCGRAGAALPTGSGREFIGGGNCCLSARAVAIPHRHALPHNTTLASGGGLEDGLGRLGAIAVRRDSRAQGSLDDASPAGGSRSEFPHAPGG